MDAMMKKPFLPILALVIFTALAPALDRESAVARLRADVSFLASDDCEGRGPGTAGIDKAADYVVAGFKATGLKGGMPDGSYFQPFVIRSDPELGRDNALTLSTAS